jgi:NitT/TauT family transport system ATP-binding protein
MRQRAALIRTLVLKPELLLLDEPFSALDYQTRLNVSDDIGKILRNSGKPAILVTHDISEAISMADRVLILSPRPATVQKIVDIHLNINNRTPLSSRNAPDFKKYFNLIWKELNENA